MSAALWPYAVVVLAGFLPNELFRVLGVLAARGVDEHSALFGWIRTVALTLLAAVVSKLLFAAPAALAHVPLPARFLSVALGVGGYYATGRRLVPGILVGETALVGSAWWFGSG